MRQPISLSSLRRASIQNAMLTFTLKQSGAHSQGHWAGHLLALQSGCRHDFCSGLLS